MLKIFIISLLVASCVTTRTTTQVTAKLISFDKRSNKYTLTLEDATGQIIKFNYSGDEALNKL